MKGMLGKDILRIVMYGVGITSIATTVWIYGPMLSIGGWHPLDSYIIREIVVLLLITAVGSFGGFHFFRRWKASKKIAEGLTEEKTADDEVVLKDRMKDALATLKTSSTSKGNYLYDLPWYVLIGPPGSGKTTALINSGLKFPLSGGASPAAIAGVGGTRYCDWWFTEEAVLIDTAGRYTTQDSDAKSDKQSWFAFLDLLKKNRPRQPINGVMVAISLEDIMTLSPQEITAHANAIRARLLELHERLKVDFPVYALFTKADLVAGFTEYFGYLGDAGRRQVWGATFQTADKKRNMVSEMPVEFDLLLERLTEEQLDRLQDEPVPNTRVTLYGFPAQMARLKQHLFDFLNQIFEPTRYHANATLRGFYFTSGTQQGTPIDQLIGSLARSFGAEQVAASSYSGQGKSYFLTDLIQKVIIGEAAWVSTDRRAVRRALILKTAAFTLIGAISIGLSLAWWVSYRQNSALIEETYKADDDYLATAGPLGKETIIADHDFNKILPALHKLRYLPAGYGTRSTPTPTSATFGLSQRERLQSSSENAYRVGLERMLRSRLIYRLEELLDTNMSNAGFIYEALKVYLMLGGQQPIQRDLVVNWLRRDWADNLYPGAAYAEGRKLLEDHLVAMLELETGPPLIELDGRLVGDAQKTLARLSVAQRAYQLLKTQSSASTAGDWVASRKGGADAERVFEAAGGAKLDTVRVPAFFTYNGFQKDFIGRLGDIADSVKKERWVLGPAGEQSVVAAQYDNLPDEMLELYTRDFIQAWRDTLSKLRLRKMLTDKPQYVALSALSAQTSPLKQMLESIRDETAVTRERANPKDAPADEKKDEKPLAVLFKSQDRAPGASIEAAFKPFAVAVEGAGTGRPVDDVVNNLNQITQNLTLLGNPQEAARANAELQKLIAALRNNASRMPPPFSDMLRSAIAEFEGDVASSTAGQLQQYLRDQVLPYCQQTISNRYPFVRGSEQDVPLADFARLFAPNGIMDGFFKQNLAPHADTSKPVWAWRQDTAVTRSFSPNTLREFQRAAQIRDAFFQTGGNIPMVSLAIKPPSLAGGTAKFEIGGTVVNSVSSAPPEQAAPGWGQRPPPTPPRPTDSTPVTVQWPSPSPRTAITVTADQAGQPSIMEKSGPWSLFRVLEAGGLRASAETATASYIMGGRELQYHISTGSMRNPLDLRALRDFRCPGGI